MTGFIAMQREALDHPLFRKNGERFYAWFWLVAKACWKPTEYDISGKIVTLQRGQVCVSRAQLAKAWNWSPSAVERFLTRLETEQMIGRDTGQGRSIVTIRNYDKYQDATEKTGQATGQAAGQAADSDRTTKEPLNHLTKEQDTASGDAHPPANDDLDEGLSQDDVIESWNELAAIKGLPKIRTLNTHRRRQLAARLREFPDPEDWRRAFRHIHDTPWLCGDNDRGWRADFDFLLQPKSFTKLTEESYGKAN